MANWTEREDGPRAPRAARMVVGPAGIHPSVPLPTPPVAGSESFNEITCDRRSKLDRSSRMRRKIHVSGEKVRGALIHTHLFALVVYFSLSFFPSSLPFFFLSFLPFRRNNFSSIFCPLSDFKSEDIPLPSYSASVAAKVAAALAAAVVTTGRKIGNFELLCFFSPLLLYWNRSCKIGCAVCARVAFASHRMIECKLFAVKFILCGIIVVRTMGSISLSKF